MEDRKAVISNAVAILAQGITEGIKHCNNELRVCKEAEKALKNKIREHEISLKSLHELFLREFGK